MTDAPPAFARAVRDPGSFRDPSGFVYRRDGVLYRQVNHSFADRWDDLVASGLLAELQSRGLLVPHETAPIEAAADPDRRPRRHPTGADPDDLLPIRVVVRDAQGRGAGDARRAGRGRGARLHPARRDRLQRPVPPRPADPHRHAVVRATPSPARRGSPTASSASTSSPRSRSWPGATSDSGCCCATTSTGSRSTSPPGSCPVARAGTWGWARTSTLTPARRAATRTPAPTPPAATKKATVSEFKQQALIDSLRRTIAKLDWTPEGTEWADYADNTSYGDAGTAAKEELVGRFLADAGGAVVWDLGANTGRYSRIAAGLGRDVVSWDIDPAAVERNYRQVRRDGDERVLPLVLDLANPSPGLGWANEERRSVPERANADVVLALALVHHLAIGRNVPLDRIASFFAGLAPQLVIEFVPKDDPMVRTLLATREDVFDDYTIDGFRAAFGATWAIVDEASVVHDAACS